MLFFKFPATLQRTDCLLPSIFPNCFCWTTMKQAEVWFKRKHTHKANKKRKIILGSDNPLSKINFFLSLESRLICIMTILIFFHIRIYLGRTSWLIFFTLVWTSKRYPRFVFEGERFVERGTNFQYCTCSIILPKPSQKKKFQCSAIFDWAAH